MKGCWQKLSRKEQILRILQFLFSLIAITAAVLQLSGLWTKAGLLATPSLGITILLQSILEWKHSRVTAVLGYLAAAATLIMFFIGVFLP